MEKSFRETLDKQLKNPEFKTEWDALEPEYQLVKEMLEAREENNLSQKNPADLSGITQADISRVESASANPSLKTLKRLAAAMGKDVQIKFVSKKPED
jgi:transcriptional regulator with XRE-family HTH domain